MGNLQFEELLWNQASAEINNFHEDNGIFNADTFQRDFKNKCQSHIFSSVGAQHHSAKADRDIQTIMNTYRVFMVNVSLHCLYHGVDDL